MACLAAPTIGPLNLPLGISLTPPALALSVDIDFCCNFPLFAIKLPLPGLTLTADILGPINEVILEVDAILEELTISCPWN